MAWELVRCLVALRNEFNVLAPDRRKASDGSIGDQAHASTSSDHNPDETGATPYEDPDSKNEVHAIDVDRDLRKPEWTMERAVDIIVTRHRIGADDRLQNVIYNRRIWSRSWGWTEREYAGSNPHDKHAHFSSRYTTDQENDTDGYGLLEADRPAQEEDDVDIQQYFASVSRAVRNDGATPDDRNNRRDFAAAMRFVGGLNFDEQTSGNMPLGPDGVLQRIEDNTAPEGS